MNTSKRLLLLLCPLSAACGLPGFPGDSPSTSTSEPAKEQTEPFAPLPDPAPLVLPPQAPPRRGLLTAVFFQPQGEPAPTAEDTQLAQRYLQAAQLRFTTMMKGADSFELSADAPRTVASQRPLSFFRGQGDWFGVPEMTGEILAAAGADRYHTDAVFVVFVMHGAEAFPPTASGAPFNGGFGTGGGVAVFPHAFLRYSNLLSTLEHELGHAAGLKHVDSYGYSMQSSDSIMSYNPAHHSNYFMTSPMPGVLIPEDLQGLALNRRLFPRLTFDHARDVPAGYDLGKLEWTLPMLIPGQPGYWLSARDPDVGQPVPVVGKPIYPSSPKWGFRDQEMWRSREVGSGRWATLELDLPASLPFDGLVVHSEHSGSQQRARGVQVEVEERGTWRALHRQALRLPDQYVPFPRTVGQRWRLSFLAGDEGQVTLRGLQLFEGSREPVPPPVPYGAFLP